MTFKGHYGVKGHTKIFVFHSSAVKKGSAVDAHVRAQFNFTDKYLQ